MRILFDNLILDATLSGGDASTNYPLTNLQDAFLQKRYQTIAAGDTTVVCTFDADVTVDVVFVGYTNAAGITATLKNSGGSTLASESFTLDNGVSAIHFASTYTTVRSIEFTVSGGAGTYVGGFAAGELYALPDPIASWEEPYTDNSTVTVSPAGQSLQNYVQPLRQYRWTFREFTRTEINALRSEYQAVGVGARVWVLPFESNQDFVEPLYATILEAPRTIKNGRRYNMTLAFQEAR